MKSSIAKVLGMEGDSPTRNSFSPCKQVLRKSELSTIYWRNFTAVLKRKHLTSIFYGMTTAFLDYKLTHALHQTSWLWICVAGVSQHVECSVGAVGGVRCFQIYYLWREIVVALCCFGKNKYLDLHLVSVSPKRSRWYFIFVFSRGQAPKQEIVRVTSLSSIYNQS